MFRVAFTVPLTARRATTTLAEGKSRRRSGQRRLLAGLWYLTGVISKRRTCGSSGFSGASERVRWNTEPAASRRRSRRRCTAGGMIPVANFLASCAGAGSTSHSRRRYPSLHSGMLSSSSALRRWCHRYVECSQARCRFNMFGGQLVLNGFKNNLMRDGSPFPSWSGCGRTGGRRSRSRSRSGGRRVEHVRRQRRQRRVPRSFPVVLNTTDIVNNSEEHSACRVRPHAIAAGM